MIYYKLCQPTIQLTEDLRLKSPRNTSETSKAVSSLSFMNSQRRNLNRSNIGSDYPENVSFTVSTSGISLTPRKPQITTNIEEWTTAFNTYMLIIVQKFPSCAAELLQQMKTIRHATKTRGGVRWCICDHKFHHKAANYRIMSQVTIVTQLWLRIFTVYLPEQFFLVVVMQLLRFTLIFQKTPLMNAITHYYQSQLRFGVRVCQECPCTPKIPRNFKPTIFSSNVEWEVALSHTAALLLIPLLRIFRFHGQVLCSRNIQTNFAQSFIFPFPNPAVLSMLLFRKTISRYSTSKLTMGQPHTSRRQLLNQPIVNFQSISMTGNYQGCNGKLSYFYKDLPFGLRGAPDIFNQLFNALDWIMLNKCSISHGGGSLDDFLTIKPPVQTKPNPQQCQASRICMLLTFKTLGFPRAGHKSGGPRQIIEFLGILLDP